MAARAGDKLIATFSVSALPNADSINPPVDVRIGDKSWHARLDMPEIAPRAPGAPIDMIGPFAATSIGEPTTHCNLPIGRLCHYHASNETITIPKSRVVWAELTWIAPAQSDFSAVTRSVRFGDDDPVEAKGVTQILPFGTAQRPFAVVSADVTADLNNALANDRTTKLDVALLPTEDRTPLRPDELTGWQLNVVWLTDSGAQHVTVGSALNLEEASQGAILIAEAGEVPRDIGALLLWNDVPLGRTEWQGTFCGQVNGDCAPITKRALVKPNGSVVVELSSPHSLAIIGPVLVQRDPDPTDATPRSEPTEATLPRP
jgi:hypothetical protein